LRRWQARWRPWSRSPGSIVTAQLAIVVHRASWPAALADLAGSVVTTSPADRLVDLAGVAVTTSLADHVVDLAGVVVTTLAGQSGRARPAAAQLARSWFTAPAGRPP
jgi:hypothetical protein